MGQTVEFAGDGGMCSGYLATPSSGAGPGILVIQEWWGLVPHIRDVCDRYAAEGFTALAVDLYHGETTTEPDEAAKLMMGLRLDRAARDMRAAAAYLRAGEAATGEGIGVVGFCMGGGLALYLATVEPAITACVAYYGVIPWPDATPQWGDVTAHVLGHFAELDGSARHETVDVLEATLRSAGVDVEFLWYPEADHAFFNDARPEVHNAAAAALSQDRTMAFFRQHLG